jgi:hypothetical protein
MVWAVWWASSAWAQFPVLTWQKFYGSDGPDVPRRLIAGPDNTLFIAGAVPDAYGETDGYIARIRLNGQTMWTRRIEGKGNIEVRDMALVGGGKELFFCGVSGAVVAHPESGDGIYGGDYLVGKMSMDGKLIFSKTYGGSMRDEALALAPIGADGALVVGTSWSADYDVENKSGGLNDAWILRLNQFGAKMTSFTEGGAKNDWAQTATPLADGGVVLAGFTNSEDWDNSESRHNGDVWIARYDFALKLLWRVIIRSPYEDMVYRVTEARDGRIVAAGSTFRETGKKQFWIIEIDADGNLLSEKPFGGDGFEELTSLYPMRDGGFLFTGYSQYNTLANAMIKGKRDLWLIRTDAKFRTLWQRTFGGPHNEEGVDVVEFRPGEIFVLGVKNNTFEVDKRPRDNDFWVLKVKERACSEMELSCVSNFNDFSVKVNEPIRFTNQSKYGERFKWEFGDGTTWEERHAVKKYTRPGIFVVKLHGYIGENCEDVYVYPKPITVEGP